ncbi:MAG TPA: DNA mismatch repair protein MutS [Nitrospiraceae bacterium]|nr:DNA mismatch repair protein MutS [Nitrospiraceae bacterium]
MGDSEATPLMRQYRDIKQGYRDAILFFRVGDFYEMFHEDAVEASKILSIALTSRDKSSESPIPLCGVPYHAATSYIAKLLKAGRTVALCDQVEDPKGAKGLVRREVVRLYTPGTLVDSEFLPPAESNVLVAIASHCRASSGLKQVSYGLAWMEVSTGEFSLCELHGDRAASALRDELARLEPKELLYPDDTPDDARRWITEISGPRCCSQPAGWFEFDAARVQLQEQLRVHSLDSFGCQGLSIGIQAAAGILRYVRETQPSASLDHIRSLRVHRPGDGMHLDSVTIRNLELVRPAGGFEAKSGQAESTLLAVLDRTVTAMGSRLLREWMLRPLLSCSAINARLAAIEDLKDQLETRVCIRSALRTVQDISRLSSRISLGIANPRDVVALKVSLSSLPALHNRLRQLTAPLITQLVEAWDNAEDLYELLEQAIVHDAPVSLRDGGILRDGYHPGVDELRKASREGKGWITALEVKERMRTGIESLKVRYNQVFGYYIEITKSNLEKVPTDYIRKQTLANAERFMTPELKELEERVTGAESKLVALEQELFEALRRGLAGHTARLQDISHRLAILDVFAALAETAAVNRYVRPLVDESSSLEICQGRHPVVERLDLSGGFIPNDTNLDAASRRLHLLTGPNMAGKSTYLRQVALIVLLAQIGSFVPATSARVGLVDRIFTRVGASDNLAGGQSTFMVEMTETAHILHSATGRSLILLDEIGRGTSTYDGLSIAWAVAEFIEDPQRLGARTLFATHYHEMTQLETLRGGIANYRVAVQETDGEVLFLRKIVPGGADRSYGIHVAKLAGLPTDVIDRAQAVLTQLEAPSPLPRPSLDTQQNFQFDATLPKPHPILDEVRQMDLFAMTPLDALNRLADLQRRLAEE